MFIHFRMFRKWKYVHLITTCFVLSIVMVCLEQLDNNVVSHMKSYSYRYLVNSYNFINESLGIGRKEASSRNNYQYLINHKDKCENQHILLLLFVKTSPENMERRQSIRSTWGNETYIHTELGASVRVIFVLGMHRNPLVRGVFQEQLWREDQRHGDLVQQDFMDSFYNLTLKLLQQFHWAHAYCSHASFVMSADDDIFVHMPNLVQYLQELEQRGMQDFWVGRVHRGAPPIRRKESKYYVPYTMYQWPSYPDYTAGAGYVVSGDVAAKIYMASMTLNTTLYIDDVFMGICANKVGVSPQEHIYFSGEGKAPYHPCIYNKMMTSHGHVKDIHYLWKQATNPKAKNFSSGLMGKLYCTAVKAFLLCRPYYLNTYPCKAAFL
ncbi:lactosylceramide 1,3-N-acetyl-beta-D-glucosaminyltransferase A [Amia ocellicauda]|uniref:lactosylceramide 1,3-N-acetyl-beta-D-glucosaminyltransferase A n=1 Tax=Amia ocellicauda TaxID=2972642 RepID=UPI003463D88F